MMAMHHLAEEKEIEHRVTGEKDQGWRSVAGPFQDTEGAQSPGRGKQKRS